MSVEVVQQIIDRLRAEGYIVSEWDGWQSRSNGSSSAYEGGIVHHTATDYGYAFDELAYGRSDLAGPLCNFSGNVDGSFTVIAAGPANHAGASGGYSMGPLPVTGNFNRTVLGLEIVYPGTAPMTDAQYRSATAWARVVADVVGWGDIERVRAHAETSTTGKWDPGCGPDQTIDMARFRADSASGVEDDLANVSDAEKAQLLEGASSVLYGVEGQRNAGPVALNLNTVLNDVKALQTAVAELTEYVKAAIT